MLRLLLRLIKLIDKSEDFFFIPWATRIRIHHVFQDGIACANIIMIIAIFIILLIIALVLSFIETVQFCNWSIDS